MPEIFRICASSSSHFSGLRPYSQSTETRHSYQRAPAQPDGAAARIKPRYCRSARYTASSMRPSPEHSCQSTSTLSNRKSAHTSYVFRSSAEQGHIQPSSHCPSRMRSIYRFARATMPSSLRRKASGIKPSSQYGTRSQPSRSPPIHLLSRTSGQTLSRLPARPAACISSCLFSHPRGEISPAVSFSIRASSVRAAVSPSAQG